MQQASPCQKLGNCDACPFRTPHPVWGKGGLGGLAVVGESPSTNEVRTGEPFTGISGQLLRASLKQCGVDPDTVYFTHATLCHSPSKPDKGTIVACNDRLWEELAAVQPSKILLVGAAALQAFLSPSKAQKITKERGRLFWTNIAGRPVLTMATWHPAAVLRSPDYFRDFARDITRLIKNEMPYPIGEPAVHITWTEAEALESLAFLETAGVLSCDIETTGLSSVDDRQLSIGFGLLDQSGRGRSFILPAHLFQSQAVRDRIKRVLFNHADPIVFHNGKFDLKFLRRDFEMAWPKNVADTLLMHYVVDERGSGGNRDENSGGGGAHGLKDLARTYFDVPDYHFDFLAFYDKANKTKEDWIEFFTYHARDCYYTRLLYDVLTAEITELEDADHTFRGHWLLENILYPASQALTEIETDGTAVDMPYLHELEKSLETKVIQIRDEVGELVSQSSQNEIVDFNPNSSDQVKKLIYDIWKYAVVKGDHKTSGGPTTEAPVLKRFQENETDPVRHHILSLISEYRRTVKFLSTYAIGLQRAADSDSRIRTSFLLSGTSTGRISSASPNLQNIPSATKHGSQFQRAFIAQPGYTLVEADFSQLELRVLAHLAKDEALTQVYLDDKDIHGEVAQILGIPRSYAKIFVFGLVYGRGPKGIVEGDEMNEIVSQGGQRWTIAQATAFQYRFLSAYPQVQEWIELQQRQALALHYVETLWGRRRRFPFITNQNRTEIMRQGANMPVQGTASDICLSALVRLQRRLPNGAAIRMTVHDSIVFEVRNDILDSTLEQIEHEMITVPFDSRVPFKVEIKTGTRWGELSLYEKSRQIA